MHVKSDKLGTKWKRVVMLQVRSKNVLALTDFNPLAGHQGVKKNTACNRRHFTWPGIS